MSKEVRFITQAAAIAAVYVVITLIFAPISFGQSGIDVRISEALTILPMFTPAAVPGVFVGCVIANIIGGGVIWDIIFGSLATLIGAVFCRAFRKNRWVAPIMTVAANTVIVPFIIRYCYGVELPIVMLFVSVGIGEAISAYGLGQVLITVFNRYGKVVFAENRA